MTTLPDLNPAPREPVVPAPRVFMIDNYDSFTYNLVQELGELGADTIVKRNDHVTLDEIAAERPTHLVVSPGPCTPNEAGISMDAIVRFGAEHLPVLGVCLGHQAIGQVYGGTVRRAGYPVHGKTGEMSHDGRGVFAGLPDPFTATRYHSLVVDEHLPSCLELSAWNEEGIVMGVRHRELPVHGVQFHPESVLTAAGLDLLRNFLVMGRDEVARRPAARAAVASDGARAGDVWPPVDVIPRDDEGGPGAE